MNIAEAKEELREAKVLINQLSRVCRQVETFMSGASCLDENRIKRGLRDAVKAVDKFMQTHQE